MKKLFFLLVITMVIFSCDSKNDERSQSADINLKMTTVQSSVAENSKNTGEENKNQLKKLTMETGLELPNSTVIHFYESAEGSDQLIRCIIEMPKNDFEAWMPTYSLNKENFAEEKRYLLGQNEKDWNPQTPKQLPTAQVQFENSKVMDIGYMEESSTQTKIYLVFHGH